MKLQTKTRNKKSRTTSAAHTASFRDPAGFVYSENGVIYRQINLVGQEDYDALMGSGLYKELVQRGWLVSHHESAKQIKSPAYKIIKPEKINFISYPYEWSFSQLKDAARLTLKIQKLALKYGLSLKDASAYNIQFQKGKPVLIDTLSFEIYKPGTPWVAYKQFCQHFLAPLALAANKDVELLQLLRIYIDGIPLPLASKLLPPKARSKLGLLMHIFWHARSQQKHASDNTATHVAVSKSATLGIIASLQKTIRKLELKRDQTEWADYYSFTNYSDKAFAVKKKMVKAFVKQARPKLTIDLGANNGPFSRVVAEAGGMVVSADIDPFAVENNYQTVKSKSEINLLPLVVDLTNPGADLGWANSERDAFAERAKQADMLMSLALIHHLAISNNLPLERIAQFFSGLSPWLIIEFVPKEDSQVKKLLATRPDIFPDYQIKGFEAAFKKYYTIKQKKVVQGSKRTLYLMKRK